jgi:Ca-activated chloride channel family protein
MSAKRPAFSMRRLWMVLAVGLLATLAYGTWRNPDFWMTVQHRGDRLMAEGKFKDAEETYRDPWHIGVAQYRNGDFKEAVQTFARVPGADGAFDQGNAALMHGAYDEAIASYDRALGFRPGWQEAIENKALAQARQKLIDDAGENREQEQADAYSPDDVVSDLKGDDAKGEPQDMNAAEMSDAELRATWLRRVQTTPGDFLRAKFAYQAAHQNMNPQPAAQEDGEGAEP